MTKNENTPMDTSASMNEKFSADTDRVGGASAKRSLLALDTAELVAWLAARKLPKFRAAQILGWVERELVTSFDVMTNLPKSLRSALDAEFSLRSTRVVRVQGTAGEPGRREGGTGTRKLLLELGDGEQIECVLLCDDREHRTACISSQVGCAMGCAFCATGLDGVVRNLTADEIFEQLLRIAELLPRGGFGNNDDSGNGGGSGNGGESASERLSNIVVMGMGEPLQNVDAVMAALQRASDPEGLNIGARRITISTVGIPAAIRQLAEMDCRFNLAISLHAPNDAMRSALIPANRSTGIAAILDAAWYFFDRTGRRVTFEYVLLDDVNDAPDHAEQLAVLLQGSRSLVNLIPYNPVAGLTFRTPGSTRVKRFAEILESHGVETSIRYRKGEKIDAACGQLRRRVDM